MDALKGAGALLARLPVARHSKDIDLYYAERATAPDAAVAAQARVADRNVRDHFRFELAKTTPLQETAKGRRVHLSAYLGSLYATFHVDIVVDTSLTGEPDTVPPLTPLLVYGLFRALIDWLSGEGTTSCRPGGVRTAELRQTDRQ